MQNTCALQLNWHEPYTWSQHSVLICLSIDTYSSKQLIYLSERLKREVLLQDIRFSKCQRFASLLSSAIMYLRLVVQAGHCHGKLKFGLLDHFNKYIYLGQVGTEGDFQRPCKELRAQWGRANKIVCRSFPGTSFWMLSFVLGFCGVLSSFISPNPWAGPRIERSSFGAPLLVISLII